MMAARCCDKRLAIQVAEGNMKLIGVGLARKVVGQFSNEPAAGIGAHATSKNQGSRYF